ncbi:hypothetical protein [Acanthopleuribacter pedis]|uniref:Zinc-finger domain-containing protein n=1 Tax=Acanthopleuribacter pedis TaxID=442870 RepID=A0A8J7U7Z5_9BACT|nr:hypothetical protein [Acanthopleuribacter pedis]MBO1323038.1 hypothetical protein [Acanthopleuribacter pedis]
MHLNLDQFNQLLKNQGAENDLKDWREHILSCRQCSQDFRALNELDQKLKEMQIGQTKLVKEKPQRKPIPLKYVLGVAAVMIMAITPYIRDSKPVAEEAAPTAPVLAQLETTTQATPALLDRVAQINYQQDVADWGKDTTVKDLVNRLPR